MKVLVTNWHGGSVERHFPNRTLTPIPGNKYSMETEVEDISDFMKLVKECPGEKAIVKYMPPGSSYFISISFTEFSTFGQR